ncbi:hypothetical protein [Pyxidicoccus caerfyrddinensis]|uniref:hypothetical protein n=1 Tax=Pyxidicoccus caerfyrddinensis TaxID=2709663 RepID=UPI0013DCB4F0|nr:hypothetical protein [Pyxidicoccus caerfyrddinensis]
MPSLVPQILQLLDAEGLRSLAAARKLPGRRSEGELRQALHAVYGGSVTQLLLELQRDDLHRLLRRPFHWQGRRYHSPELARFSKEQLLKFANTLFVKGEVPSEFGKESGRPEFLLETPTPVASPKPTKEPRAIAPAVLDDDESTGKTVVAPAMRFLVMLSHDWGRPRSLRNVLTDLGLEVPERLRGPRFQEAMKKLASLGVEMADAESGALLTPRDASPGVNARVRLRRVRT